MFNSVAVKTKTVTNTKILIAVTVLLLAGGLAFAGFKVEKSNFQQEFAKCGVNNFKVMNRCWRGYRNMRVGCHDGFTYAHNDTTSCKSISKWQMYAREICDDRCAVTPVCGNGIVESGEDCDNGTDYFSEPHPTSESYCSQSCELVENRCDVDGDILHFTVPAGQNANLAYNKWATAFHTGLDQFQFGYFDTFNNDLGTHNVGLGECSIDYLNTGAAFQVNKFDNEEIEFAFTYNPETILPPVFDIPPVEISTFTGERDILGMDDEVTTLQGKFYLTDNITLVCSDPCPPELDENIRYFLSLQTEVLSCFENDNNLSFTETGEDIRNFLYILSVSNEEHEGIAFSAGRINLSLYNDGAYTMERLPGFYPPGSSYLIDQENVRADLHETKHILQAILLGRTGKFTAQFSEGDAIATDEFLDCEVPKWMENRIGGGMASIWWNCLKDGGTVESCNVPTLNMVNNENVSCDEMIPVNSHEYGSILFAAMNQEYGCDYNCMRRIFIKLGQLTQPDGNELFSWTTMLPTNIEPHTEYRNEPSQFGELFKEVADEETEQDTSLVFDRLCFPR